MASKGERRMSRRGFWAVGVGGLVVLGLLLWFARNGAQPLAEQLGVADAVALRCTPDLDFTASYRLSLSTELKLNAAALITDSRSRGRMLSSDAGYDGRLRVRALSRRREGTVLAMQVDDIESTSGSADASGELTSELEKPFFVVLGDDCRIAESGFAPELSAEAINRQQALVDGLSVVVARAADEQTWRTREHDNVGEYTASYDREPGTDSRGFVKQRTAYVNVHAQVGQRFKEPLLVRVLSSTTPAELDRERAWLARLDNRDHLQITRKDGTLVADLKTTLSLARDLDAADPLEVALQQNLRWRNDREPPLLAEVRPVEPPPFMKTLTLEAALAQYAALLRSGKSSAIVEGADFLALLLRAQPGLAFALMSALERGTLAPDLESTVFLALEIAGTPESHAALVSGLADNHAARNRARAAAALPDVKNPSHETLAALASTAREAVAETKDETRLVRNSATYALGALEERTRGKNAGLSNEAVTEIRSRLDEAGDSSDLAATLDAIGNSGNSAFIEDLKPHLGAKDTLVRSHAIQAMGNMDPNTTKAEFRGLMSGEEDPSIRGTIARTYADQARHADSLAPTEVVHAAVDVLAQEADPRVRGQLIDLIGPSSASDPRVMQALARQFKHESDPVLMRAIGRYVPADKLGS